MKRFLFTSSTQAPEEAADFLMGPGCILGFLFPQEMVSHDSDLSFLLFSFDACDNISGHAG